MKGREPKIPLSHSCNHPAPRFREGHPSTDGNESEQYCLPVPSPLKRGHLPHRRWGRIGAPLVFKPKRCLLSIADPSSQRFAISRGHLSTEGDGSEQYCLPLPSPLKRGNLPHRRWGRMGEIKMGLDKRNQGEAEPILIGTTRIHIKGPESTQHDGVRIKPEPSR